MKVSKLTIASAVFCLISLACYNGYSYMNNTMADQTYPVITIDEPEIAVSIEEGQDALLKGVTAYDEKDGDVTDSIVVESVTRFANGKRTVTYVAFDKDNHVSKAQREISYTDYESPKFSCVDGYRFPVGAKSVIDTMAAKDCIDGNLNKVIKAANGSYVDTSIAGTYPFQYQVANSAGDVEYLPVTIEIYDPKDSNIIHFELKEYVVYTTVGKKINAKSYLDVEEPEYYNIDESEVNYNEPGVYEILYSIKMGDKKGTNRLAVVVR